MKDAGIKDEVLVLGEALENLLARVREAPGKSRSGGPVFPPPSGGAPPAGGSRGAASPSPGAASTLPPGEAEEAADLVRRAIARLRELA